MKKAVAEKSSENFFDFKADATLPKSFALDYLRQYYLPEREVSIDEEANYRFIRRIAPRLKPGCTALEVGCGPTVHHAVMLAPFVGKIDLADYLEENLALVETWQKGGPDVWDWTDYSIFCSAEDGIEPNEEAIKNREALTRSRIGTLRTINLLTPEPLGPNAPKFDLVGTFYCTEEVALTLDGWREVMRGVQSLIRPGGHLLLTCLANTSYYNICAADNSVRSLPCAEITRADMDAMLDELGFSVEERLIEEYQTPEQEYEGVQGVLMAFARLDG